MYKELDIDVEGVDPTQGTAVDKGAQAEGSYDETDGAEDSVLDDENIIADLGGDDGKDEDLDGFTEMDDNSEE